MLSVKSWGSVYVHQDFTESTGFCCSGIFLLFIERSFLLGPPNLSLTYRGSVYVHQDFTESREKCCNFCARLNHFLGVYGKNEDYHPLCFFMLFMVVYFVFSVDAFFMEKIAKQNRLFRLFSKKPKQCSWKRL